MLQRSVLKSVIRSSSLLISILALSSGCHGGSEGSEPASLSKDKSPIKFTIVGKSANLAIHASGARHLFINVTSSEAPKPDFRRFSRYCLIEHWSPMTTLKFGTEANGFQPDLIEANRTYFCYESVSQLRQHHSDLVWTGDHGIRKGAPVPADDQEPDFTHTVFKFECSGVKNLAAQHTCEVLPTKPGGNRQCFIGAEKYGWGGNLGELVCLGGWNYFPGLKVSDLRGCINSEGEPTHSGRDGSFVCGNSR